MSQRCFTWLREHTTHDVANPLNEIKSVKQNGKGELIISQSWDTCEEDFSNLYLNTESDLVCKSKFLPVIIPDNKYSNIGNLITEINNSIKNTIDYYNKEIFPKCTNNSDISNDMITSEDIKFE